MSAPPRLPKRWINGLGIILVIAGAALVPAAVRPVYVILGISIMVTALFGMSFNLLYGYAGLFSFGQAGFYGLGAYGTGLLLNHTHLGFFVALPLMMVLTGAVAALLGVIIVGLDRIAFVMLTFAAAELLGFASLHLVSITSGDSGLIVNAPNSLNIVSNTNGVYYVVLIITLVILALLFLLVRSPFGLTLQAIRQNPVRTETVGVNVWRQKLIVFSIAGAVAGAAGSISAVTDQVLYPLIFGWLISANGLIVTLLGGSGYFLGPVLGSVIFGLVGLYAGRLGTDVVTLDGIVFIAIVLLAPQGLVGLIAKVIRLFRRRRPSKREPTPVASQPVLEGVP